MSALSSTTGRFTFGTKDKRMMKHGLAVIASMIGLLTIASPVEAATGDHYSIAPTVANGTSAPAFPSATAFWAGVCDLDDSAAAVGVRPAGAFADCIEHPSTGDYDDPLVPPLPPGVSPNTNGPDGWIRDVSHTLIGGPSWRLDDVVEAGSRPDATTTFWFSRNRDNLNADQRRLIGTSGSDGAPRDITVGIPPGVVGNPNAVPKCPAEALTTVPVTCPPKTQIGVSTVQVGATIGVYPVYNVEPRDGKTAEFVISRIGITGGNHSNVPVVARARTEDDFGIDAMAVQVPAGLTLVSQTFTVWGVPWAASHDKYRPVTGYCGAPSTEASLDASGSYGMPLTGLPGGIGGKDGGCSQEPRSYDPSWGPIRPFFTTQTDCAESAPTSLITSTNWHTDVIATAASVAPQLTDCGALEFPADIDLQPTGASADGPSGLDVELTVGQNNDPPASVRFDNDDDTGAPAYWKTPAGRASAHLEKTVVDLPEGLAVNPSAATGLAGCSDAQVGLRGTDFPDPSPLRFDNDDPFDGAGAECPAGSIIGTGSARTPLLDETLTGQLVLGVPKSTDPQSGEMFRMFLVLRNRERGLLAKVAGSAVADPATGRLTATFAKNPQVPVEEIEVHLKGGDRGVLAMPQACGAKSIASELTPWTAAGNAGGQAKSFTDAFAVGGDCSFGFAPKLISGMSTQKARGTGTFSFRFSREDGERWFDGLTAVLPTGLLASVKDVPLCSDAQAAVGACPAGSRIGTVDASAGSGTPFVLERKGTAYLTEGYKGCAYGLAVVVPVVAGPFDGSSPATDLGNVVVRQKVCVDPTDARVTAVSDPFPTIWHGIPLRVRSVTVNVDRPDFMLNPSDCDGKQVAATLSSVNGGGADRTVPFQAAGCAGLAFEPKLTLALTGRKQVTTGRHPGVKAKVTQTGVSEAGIARAEVRLPKSLALDPDNAQALCEFADGTTADPENHCPKGSIIGRARAVSPLLNKPLVGNVYFVKNVRRSSSGNLIRTLPMLVVALRGEIAVNLKGTSDTKGGKLVNVFDQVPDAPISQFNMNVKGGKRGILAVTRTRRSLINLCTAGRQVAEADTDGQNGRRHDFDVRMGTPCAKRAKGAKRKHAQRRRAGH